MCVAAADTDADVSCHEGSSVGGRRRWTNQNRGSRVDINGVWIASLAVPGDAHLEWENGFVVCSICSRPADCHYLRIHQSPEQWIAKFVANKPVVGGYVGFLNRPEARIVRIGIWLIIARRW